MDKHYAQLFDGRTIRMSSCSTSPSCSSVAMQQHEQQLRVIGWTKRIAAAANRREAITTFHYMQLYGVRPDRVTFLTILNICASPGGISDGEAIHSMLESCLIQDLPLANALADMYCKNRCLEQGRKVFDATKHNGDVISWNAMMTAYAQNGHPHEALRLFHEMELQGVSPVGVTFTLVLRCVTDKRMTKVVHERVRSAGFEVDVIVGTGLVNMYARFGYVTEAEAVFNRIISYSSGDVVLWTSMVGAYAEHGETHEALVCFRLMQLNGLKPNRVAFITLLTACASPSHLAQGKEIHEQLKTRYSVLDVGLGNAVMCMYIKCGDLTRCLQVFEFGMHEHDIISWNTIIGGYASSLSHQEFAIEMLWEMLLDGAAQPDRITLVTLVNACNDLELGYNLHLLVVDSGMTCEEVLNALVHMYSRCGHLNAASFIFQILERRTENSWAAMVTALSQNGFHKRAIQFFQQMQLQGLRPDKVAFTAALDSASAVYDSVSSHRSQCIQTAVTESGLHQTEAIVGTALIHLLGITGDVDEAFDTFCKIVEPDRVAWNAMMSTYARHGHIIPALELLQKMHHEGVEPDSVTFVSLLSCCSHAGLVQLGMECFVSMTRDCGITKLTPELSGCVIDLLGRVGRLDDAEVFVEKFLDKDADVNQWMAYLCASKNQGDMKRTNCAAKQVLARDPNSSAAYVLSSYTAIST